MADHELRHLAVIAGTARGDAVDAGTVATACCAKASEIAAAAFGAIPDLRAFSWAAPAVDRLLALLSQQSVARAGLEGYRLLAKTAAALGATLRVCGRIDDLPVDALQPPAPSGGRTLLWLRRYSGREEIVRAATRFLAAHPDGRLEDAELDLWLDTAGVPDPDLLVFAGGTLEPLDTLLWQGSYAEIWHTTQEWPELSALELNRALEAFAARQRRFGR